MAETLMLDQRRNSGVNGTNGGDGILAHHRSSPAAGRGRHSRNQMGVNGVNGADGVLATGRHLARGVRVAADSTA